jgi:hypothetical protein
VNQLGPMVDSALPIAAALLKQVIAYYVAKQD